MNILTRHSSPFTRHSSLVTRHCIALVFAICAAAQMATAAPAAFSYQGVLREIGRAHV